jgi:hypothetical protein
VVNDWTSATYTTGNFFIATTTVVAATGSVSLTAATWADITPLAATVSAAANNVVVIFWTDSTQAQNVTLDFANVALREGAVPPPFVAPTVQSEIERAQRYYEKSFALETAPAEGLGAGTSNEFRDYGITAATEPQANWRFKVEKRTTPTVTLYCPRAGGTTGQWTNNASELANARALSPNSSGVIIDNTGTTATTGVYMIQAVADARL